MTVQKLGDWIGNRITAPWQVLRWTMVALIRIHHRRQKHLNQRQLISLGDHLLRDLGFDPSGRPLAPDWSAHAKREQGINRLRQTSRGMPDQCTHGIDPSTHARGLKGGHESDAKPISRCGPIRSGRAGDRCQGGAAA